jgi:hypothetical protein
MYYHPYELSPVLYCVSLPHQNSSILELQAKIAALESELKVKDEELKKRPTEIRRVVLDHNLLHDDPRYQKACNRLTGLPSPEILDALYDLLNSAQLFERSRMLSDLGRLGWQKEDTSGNMSEESSECGSDNFPQEEENWQEFTAEPEQTDDELSERMESVEIIET